MMKFNKQKKLFHSKGVDFTYTLVPWDSRYFNNKTFEIEDLDIRNGTTMSEDVLRWQHRVRIKKGDLLVLKVQPELMKYRLNIQQMGFIFVEESVELFISLHEWKPVSLLSNSYLFTLRNATKRDVPRLQHMAEFAFSMDRFHLDTKLTKEQANIRYREWVKNSFNSREQILMFEDQRKALLGFFIFKAETNDICNLRLACIDNSNQNKGFGLMMYNQTFMYIKQHGYSHMKTQISLNNISVLNLYCFLAHPVFSRPTYVFHKHVI